MSVTEQTVRMTAEALTDPNTGKGLFEVTGVIFGRAFETG